MKKLLLMLVMIAGFVTIAKAQEPTVETRLDAVEQQMTDAKTQITALQQTIATLQTQVAEVTRQNLALKQTLHLQPTIATGKTDQNFECRLISATGNRQTGELTFIFSVTNLNRKDILFGTSEGLSFITENGIKYNEKAYKELSVASQNTKYTYVPFDTPIEVKIVFYVNPDFEYAKTVTFDAIGSNKFQFTNIPIKWE